MKLSDGYSIPYLEGGRDNGVVDNVLLLIHGFGSNKDSFSSITNYLTPKMRVIIPDLPGFGATVKSFDEDYTVNKQAERINMFIEALGLSSVHIGGSSMGGGVSGIFVTKYPDKVLSVWLLSPATGTAIARASDVLTHYDRTGESILLPGTYEEFHTMYNHIFNNKPYIPTFILNMVADEYIRHRAIHEFVFNMNINETNNLPQILNTSRYQNPILLMWGDKDRILHVNAAYELLEHVPHTQLIIMNDVGHCPHMEKPEESARHYLHFRKLLIEEE